MIRIFPSLISSNILNIEKTIKDLEASCDGFHIDVMDGNFVDNLTMGPMFINAISKITKKTLFIHLMTKNTQKLIKMLKIDPKDIICFHIETQDNVLETIELIKEKKCLPGIAIRPQTSLDKIIPFLSNIYEILLMSVEPGYSGQAFLPNTKERLNYLIELKKANLAEFRIAMDGGINKSNIKRLARKGVEDFAIGSAVFSKGDHIENLKELYRLAKK